MNLTITLTSDFICPWCFVAERRLQQALEQMKRYELKKKEINQKR